MFIAAIYFLLQRSGPTSSLVTKVKLDGGGILLLYKEAQLIEQKKEDGKLVLTIDGKAYVSTERSNIPYVVLTEEAKTELVKGSAVIDASEPYTTAVMVGDGSVSFLPNPSNHIGRLSPIELVPGEKGLVTPNAKGVS